MLIWSSCFVAIRGTIGAAPSLLYAGLRAAIAAVVLLAVAAAGGRLRPPPGTWPWLVALGLANTTIGLAGMFLSVELAGAALPAVLANSQALLVAPAAAWLWGERLDLRAGAGLGLGFIGVAVVVSSGSAAGGTARTAGLILALAAALGLAAGNLVIKHLAGRVDAITAVAWQYAVGAAGLLIWSLFANAPWDVRWHSPRFLVGLAYLGVVASAGASWAWYRLLEKDDLVPLNALTLLTPTLSVALAWLLFRESVPGATWIGVAATLAGVAAVSYPRGRSADMPD